LSYKENITPVGQFTSLANAPTDRQGLKQLQTAGGNQADQLLGPTLDSSVENYDVIELDVDSIYVEAVLASVFSGSTDSFVVIDSDTFSGAGTVSRGSSAYWSYSRALSSYVSVSSAASLTCRWCLCLFF